MRLMKYVGKCEVYKMPNARGGLANSRYRCEGHITSKGHNNNPAHYIKQPDIRITRKDKATGSIVLVFKISEQTNHRGIHNALKPQFFAPTMRIST